MVKVVDGFLVPTPETYAQPFWNALEKDEFKVPYCTQCSEYFFPPMPRCPCCAGSKVEFKPVSGRGTLYSWVTTHFAFHPSFKSELPYTAGVIDLEEGPRIYTRLEGPIDKAPRAGARLNSRIQQYRGFKYPVFFSAD